MSDRFLEVDVQLLVLRYGRSRVIEALAVLGEETVEDVEQRLATIVRETRSPKAKKATRRRQSVDDVVESAEKKRPEISEPLRSLAGQFEGRSFLPQLRDVRRFLERLGAKGRKYRSRVDAGPSLFRLLSTLDVEDLRRLASGGGRDEESEYSLLAEAIMNPERTRRE